MEKYLLTAHLEFSPEISIEITVVNFLIFFNDKIQVNLNMISSLQSTHEIQDLWVPEGVTILSADLQKIGAPNKLINHLFNYKPHFTCSPIMLKGISSNYPRDNLSLGESSGVPSVIK